MKHPSTLNERTMMLDLTEITALTEQATKKPAPSTPLLRIEREPADRNLPRPEPQNMDRTAVFHPSDFALVDGDAPKRTPSLIQQEPPIKEGPLLEAPSARPSISESVASILRKTQAEALEEEKEQASMKMRMSIPQVAPIAAPSKRWLYGVMVAFTLFVCLVLGLVVLMLGS